jgi:hypothetical protein
MRVFVAGAGAIFRGAGTLAERLGAGNEYAHRAEPFARGAVSMAYAMAPNPGPLGWMGIAAADSLGVVAACGAIETHADLLLPRCFGLLEPFLQKENAPLVTGRSQVLQGGEICVFVYGREVGTLRRRVRS